MTIKIILFNSMIFFLNTASFYELIKGSRVISENS